MIFVWKLIITYSYPIRVIVMRVRANGCCQSLTYVHVHVDETDIRLKLVQFDYRMWFDLNWLVRNWMAIDLWYQLKMDMVRA